MTHYVVSDASSTDSTLLNRAVPEWLWVSRYNGEESQGRRRWDTKASTKKGHIKDPIVRTGKTEQHTSAPGY